MSDTPAPAPAAPPRAPAPALAPALKAAPAPLRPRLPVPGERVMYRGPAETDAVQVMAALVLQVHSETEIDVHLFRGTLLGGSKTEDGRWIPAYEREHVTRVDPKGDTVGWFWTEG